MCLASRMAGEPSRNQQAQIGRTPCSIPIWPLEFGRPGLQAPLSGAGSSLQNVISGGPEGRPRRERAGPPHAARAGECSDDGMVFCLGRRPAWAHAAEMVIRRVVGAGRPSGCHRSLHAERRGEAPAAGRTGKTASNSRRQIAGCLNRLRVPRGSARSHFEHVFLRNIANLISLPA